MGPYAFQGFADMGNSFLKSYKGELDRLEQQRRYDQEQAWKDEQRGRQRQEWQREDDFNRVIQEEYAPVEPTVEYGAGDEGPTQAFQVRGKQFQTRDAADQYAASENAPTRRLMRAADRAMAIDPTRATKLRNDAMTSGAAELQLTKAEQDQADEIYNRQILGMLAAAPNWWDGAAKIGEVMLKGNGQAGAELTPDGKTVRLFAVDAEGKRTERGEFPANAQGRELYLQSTMKTNAAGKMAFITSMADAEREYDKRQQTRAEGLEDYKAKLKLEEGSAIRRYNATTGSRTATEDPTVKKIAAIEGQIGRKLTEQEKLGLFNLKVGQPETIRSVGDGLFQQGDRVYAIDPATGQPKQVNFGPSEVERRLAQFRQGVQDGRPSMAVATGALTPFSKSDIERGATVDPRTLERRSERSVFGGQPTYYYVDPKTGRKYSADEYNQLGR